MGVKLVLIRSAITETKKGSRRSIRDPFGLEVTTTSDFASFRADSLACSLIVDIPTKYQVQTSSSSQLKAQACIHLLLEISNSRHPDFRQLLVIGGSDLLVLTRKKARSVVSR